MVDVLLLHPPHLCLFFLPLMKKQTHRDIMQLAEVIEPELEVRLFVLGSLYHMGFPVLGKYVERSYPGQT